MSLKLVVVKFPHQELQSKEYCGKHKTFYKIAVSTKGDRSWVPENEHKRVKHQEKSQKINHKEALVETFYY